MFLVLHRLQIHWVFKMKCPWLNKAKGALFLEIFQVNNPKMSNFHAEGFSNDSPLIIRINLPGEVDAGQVHSSTSSTGCNTGKHTKQLFNKQLLLSVTSHRVYW